MKREIKDKWIEALRSGKYEQGRDLLCKISGGEKHCCLGVLCELAPNVIKTIRPNLDRRLYDGKICYLPKSVQNWAGMRTNCGQAFPDDLSLIALNDSGFTFPQIADFISKNWEEL